MNESSLLLCWEVELTRRAGGERYRVLLDARTGEVQLKARLAELPTVTEVGMNVLAPLALSGKLRPDIDAKHNIRGFRAMRRP